MHTVYFDLQIKNHLPVYKGTLMSKDKRIFRTFNRAKLGDQRAVTLHRFQIAMLKAGKTSTNLNLGTLSQEHISALLNGGVRYDPVTIQDLCSQINANIKKLLAPATPQELAEIDFHFQSRQEENKSNLKSNLTSLRQSLGGFGAGKKAAKKLAISQVSISHFEHPEKPLIPNWENCQKLIAVYDPENNCNLAPQDLLAAPEVFQEQYPVQ